MDQLFTQLIATIIGGTLAILGVAAIVLRRFRNRQLRRLSGQLGEVLADSLKGQ